jgi:hypothetical protein
MGLPTKDFPTLVADMVSAWAAELGYQPTLQDGDALYAMMEATCSQLVFMQAQVTIINNVARAQTCGSDLNNGTTDADLDSFYAQFGFTRLQGQQAIGPVTLGKLSPATAQVPVPAGTLVQTVGGAIQYQLVADTNQAAWNPTLNAYVFNIGQSSITATAQALLAGSNYNVTAGQLSQIATNVPGVDTVTNTVPITNGANAEPNPAFRTRFVQFLNSLSKATQAAIQSAINGVQQNIESNLQENVNTIGGTRLGEFVATIDDGTGDPPSSLLTAVFNAVNAVRGFTIYPQVVPISDLLATIVIVIRVAAGFVTATVEAAVENAIVAAVNDLPIGGTCFINATIVEAALSVPGCTSVQPNTTTINSAAADLVPTGFQGVRTNINLVTASSY